MVVKSSTKSSLLVDQGNYNCLVSTNFASPHVFSTYVANIDDGARITTRSRKVGKRVRWCSDWRRSIEAATRSSAETSTKAATSAKATAKAATTTHEPTTSSSSEATGEASTTTHKSASSATESTTRGAGEAILSDLKSATVPFVPVELLDSVLSVFRIVKSNDSGTLHASIWSDVDIGAHYGASVGWEDEKSATRLDSPQRRDMVK